MAANHAQLTGADLHEPKGVATASAGTVYIANGSGSGVWSPQYTAPTTANTLVMSTPMIDVASASSVFFYIPSKAILTASVVTLYDTLTGANATLSYSVNNNLIGDTTVVAFTGSGPGVATYDAIAYNTPIAAGSVIKVTTDGGPTNTGAVRADISLILTYAV